jgi:hypothetical protein
MQAAGQHLLPFLGVLLLAPVPYALLAVFSVVWALWLGLARTARSAVLASAAKAAKHEKTNLFSIMRFDGQPR